MVSLPGRKSKFERGVLLREWGYNVPLSQFIPRASCEVSWASFFSKWDTDRVSIRAQSEHHKVHFPNITFKELKSKLVELDGLPLVITPGIDPQKCLWAGCLAINDDRHFVLELVKGPATVRDLTYGRKPVSLILLGDFESRIFSESIGGIDTWLSPYVSEVIEECSSFPESGIVLELSIYGVPVGGLKHHVIFWDFIYGDHWIPEIGIRYIRRANGFT